MYAARPSLGQDAALAAPLLALPILDRPALSSFSRLLSPVAGLCCAGLSIGDGLRARKEVGKEIQLAFLL